jgi:hypothetical protein
MAYLLFLTLPPALWLLWKLPYWEAARDYAAILANGAADNLHEAFHRGRALRRLGIVAAVSAAAALPLWGHWPSWAALAGALVVGGLGWFFYTFNTQLSGLRGLDPYYISSDPHAAFFPDRYVYQHALDVVPADSTATYVERIARASFKLLSTLLLWLAAAVSLLLIGAALFTY